MSKLSEALELARETKGYSARKIADLAKDAGYSLSNKTVSQYLNGQHGTRPDAGTLEALSHVLGIGVNALRDLAKLPPVIENYQPPSESAALTPRQRRLVDELIRELAAKNSGSSMSVPDDVMADYDMTRGQSTEGGRDAENRVEEEKAQRGTHP